MKYQVIKADSTAEFHSYPPGFFSDPNLLGGVIEFDDGQSFVIIGQRPNAVIVRPYRWYHRPWLRLYYEFKRLWREVGRA